MKKLIIVVLALSLVAGVAYARMNAAFIGIAGVVAEPASSYLLEENFSTGSAPDGWNLAGTWAWNIEDPALYGTYSARAQSWSTDTAWKSFSSQTDVYGYARVRRVAGADIGFSFRDSSGTAVAYVAVAKATGVVTVLNSSAQGGTMTDAMDVDTTYHLWFRYKAHGSAGILTAGYSTDGTRPTSGTKFYEKTDCTVNTAVERIMLAGGSDNKATYFGRILVSDAEIGNTP